MCPGARYLLAVCAKKLDKVKEAEMALQAGNFGTEGAPHEAYAYELMGQICKAANRNAQAHEFFSKALKLKPTLWVCWENMCQLGADEDERNYFREAEMAQALGQAQDAIGHSVGSSQAIPLTALVPNNSHTNMSIEVGATGSTPGLLNAMPGTPMSAATPLGNSSIYGAATPLNNTFGASPMPGAHGNGTGALSFTTPASASSGGLIPAGGEQTPDMPTGMQTPGAMVPPPLAGKGPAPPRRGRISTGGDVSGRGGRGVLTGPSGFGAVRSLDGENTDPGLGNSSPATHTGASSRDMPPPVSATRRVTRSATATATSTGALSNNLALGGDSSRPGSSASGSTATTEEAMTIEEDLPPHKKKPHLQQSGMTSSLGSRQQQTWQTTGSGWNAACQSPRLQDQAQVIMPPTPAETSELCQLFRQLANAYRHLTMYRSHEAIKAFNELPKSQANTGWVLAQLATAHFNMAQHRQAESCFRRCRQLEPHRVRSMEVYSTVLWFLKREHELCYLAQEMVALDRLAPQTWCVLGNCFSLQREFETAIKFFHRAIQVDPTFTYAYTLAGHEHVSNEDFDKATASFRDALRYDQRHYNAWYGLGTIYLKQEKYQLAEYHFRRALEINPRNSVLHCYRGMALLSNHTFDQAIAVLQKAKEMDPANPLARLRKAMALSHVHRDDEALEELLALQQLAPRESTVHVQMGKVLKKLGRLHEALASFNHALDLDPKSGNMIKAHIDRLQMSDIEDDSML